MMTVRSVLFMIIFLFLFSCQVKEKENSRKPIVLVSIPPYAYFVKKIAQDTVDIETLVPSGANPHIYEATPKEAMRFQKAALWVYLGEPIDKKILQSFKDTKQKIQIVDVTQGIPLLSLCEEEKIITENFQCHHSHNEGKDLHIWLSPTLAKLQAHHIAEALISLLPDQQMKFKENLQNFLDELDHLNQEICNILKPMKGKAILVSHPGLGYFCRDYHLIQLSVEIEGKEPLPKQVTEILANTKHYSIQTILVEPQFSNKGAELIAKSLGLSTHPIDPLAENYSENLIAIAKVIAE